MYDDDGCCAKNCCGEEREIEIYIEAVTVCVNNADFLAHTLPANYHHFDKFVVVTAPEDKATRQLCEYYGVEVVLTDRTRSRWNEFCKGAAINDGLAKLSQRGWLLHIDADCVLPPNFRKTLKTADLDPRMIYGADRAEFKSYADYQRFRDFPEPQRQAMFIHTTHTLPYAQLGTRVGFGEHGGYVPIGFFQLWNCPGSGEYRYPEGHTTAAREDVLFPARWPRSKRGFLPEVIVHHLESEHAAMGVNWKGRQTKPFKFPEGSKQ